jgi:hypothetical protein
MTMTMGVQIQRNGADLAQVFFQEARTGARGVVEMTGFRRRSSTMYGETHVRAGMVDGIVFLLPSVNNVVAS